MMISAVLSNADHPEYGVATIPFPIPKEQYDHCMEMMEAQFCFVCPNLLGSLRTAVIPEIHSESKQPLRIHIGHRIPDQTVIAAVFIFQHGLRRGKKVLLKSPF